MIKAILWSKVSDRDASVPRLLQNSRLDKRNSRKHGKKNKKTGCYKKNTTCKSSTYQEDMGRRMHSMEDCINIEKRILEQYHSTVKVSG